MAVDIPVASVGDWLVERHTVNDQEAALAKLRAGFRDGRWTPAGTYTGLKHKGALVMSDTPDEKEDHHDPLRQVQWRGKGGKRARPITCLVNGLGLGMVIAGMLSFDHVERVTVVEIAPEVIELVGTHLTERYGDRLEIVHADALEWKSKRGRHWDVVWHDIWPTICGDNWPTMGKLHRKYGSRCAWQGSWLRETVLELHNF